MRIASFRFVLISDIAMVIRSHAPVMTCAFENQIAQAETVTGRKLNADAMSVFSVQISFNIKSARCLPDDKKVEPKSKA